MNEVLYRFVDWHEAAAALQQVRLAVFVVEQGVPESEEWDEADFTCRHVIATLKREPIATGRLAPDGKVGRLAVVSEHRGQGIGARVLALLLEEATRRKLQRVYLHAQVNALPFYERFGFTAEGDTFDEAGIAHRRMRLELE